jgi:hypothetical protein
MASPSLLQLTRALATDDETKAAYREDPDTFLAARGHGDLDPQDLATALEHVADALPAPLAAALTTAGEAGDSTADLLAGVAGIDPTAAELAWAARTGEASDDLLDEQPEHDLGVDPQDLDLDGPDREDTDLDADPADLDEGDQPGGHDPAGGSLGEADEPGGFDRAPADESATFGTGTGTGTDAAADAAAGDDPPDAPVAGDDGPVPGAEVAERAWDDRPDGLDEDLPGGAEADDGPGGFDPADELD